MPPASFRAGGNPVKFETTFIAHQSELAMCRLHSTLFHLASWRAIDWIPVCTGMTEGALCHKSCTSAKSNFEAEGETSFRAQIPRSREALLFARKGFP